MKHLTYLIAAIMLVSLSGNAFAATQVSGPEICGNDEYMSLSNGEYYIWNFNSGSQCIYSDGGTAWHISQNSQTGASGSMPLIFKGCHWGTWCTSNSGMPIRISSMSGANSSWSISGTAASGNWNASYDCWISKNGGTAPDGVELMIWFSWAGTHTPAGSIVADNINISGINWELWATAFSNWEYIAYRAKSQITSANLDIKAFIQDLINRGYCQSSWWLDAIEAGYEIEDTGAVGLKTNSFSASVSGGGSTTTTAASTTTTAASTTTSTTSASTSTTTTAASTTTTAASTTTTAASTTTTAASTTTTTSGGGSCTCDSGCDGSSISPNFTKDGAGQFCWQATSGTYINSWNTNKVEVNNTVYTNQYVLTSSFPAKINGVWYIYYDSSVAWGHFELKN